MGAFVDRTTAKRALVIAGAVTVTTGALAMPLFPRFFAISILQALTGVGGSVFVPALAAITLGLVGTRFFSRRVGHNAAMLPLVGQVLALQNTDVSTALMATCIVAAQVVMVPMAYLRRGQGRQLGTKADLSGWFRRLDGSRLALHPVRQLVLAGRRADPRRRRRWDFSVRCSRSSCRT